MDGDEEHNRPVAGGNVTFDPLAAALPVEKPAIREVLDCKTGEFVDARSWIGGQGYEQLIAQRVSVREGLSAPPASVVHSAPFPPIWSRTSPITSSSDS